MVTSLIHVHMENIRGATAKGLCLSLLSGSAPVLRDPYTAEFEQAVTPQLFNLPTFWAHRFAGIKFANHSLLLCAAAVESSTECHSQIPELATFHAHLFAGIMQQCAHEHHSQRTACNRAWEATQDRAQLRAEAAITPSTDVLVSMRNASQAPRLKVHNYDALNAKTTQPNKKQSALGF
jgi:hypothetical protein